MLKITKYLDTTRVNKMRIVDWYILAVKTINSRLDCNRQVPQFQTLDPTWNALSMFGLHKRVKTTHTQNPQKPPTNKTTKTNKKPTKEHSPKKCTSIFDVGGKTDQKRSVQP